MVHTQATQPQKILILAAIPQGLRLDKEMREVEECIRRADRGNMFEVGIRTAVRTQDIRRAIAEEKPQIVHFCGHGLEDGSLLLEDDGGQNKAVPPEGLASLFQLHKDYVNCVLLNACHSVKSAEAISEYINYAIGMNQQIQDNSAIRFAQGFYDGLGYEISQNQDCFHRAFQEGLVAIKLENLSQGEIPVIKTRINIDKPHQLDKPDKLNVQNITFQSSGSIIHQAPPSQFKNVPPLLPYLANRREQEAQLSEVFVKFFRQDLSNHLVCIIHGDESQCHYNFLERMRKFSLPQCLEIDSHPQIIHKPYQLEWPAKVKDLCELRNHLYKSLAKGVLGNSLYSSEKINDYLNNYPEPITVYTTLLTEDLQQQGLESLNKLLEFCHHLQETITHQRLIIYISIKYKVQRKTTRKNIWFKLLSSCGRDFCKEYRCQQINKKVRQYLKNLENSNLNHFHPLSLTILPELQGINQGEVENWVRSEHTKQLVGEEMIEPLIHRVREMFASWEESQKISDDTIPMYDLAQELEQLLRACNKKSLGEGREQVTGDR